MLDLLKNDAPIGSRINIFLLSGEQLSGTLEEIGGNYILLNVGNYRKRIFEAFIGGWDISESENIVESTPAIQANDTQEDAVNCQTIKKILSVLSPVELTYFFAPNASIISADKKNVLIHMAQEDVSYYVPYKFIASQGLISEINEMFMSGEDSNSTSIPVYVGLFTKDKQHSYPNIVLEPGTVQEYIDLLTNTLLNSNEHNLLAKNLTFVLWRGCSNSRSREATKQLRQFILTRASSSHKEVVCEKDFISELDSEIAAYDKAGKDYTPLLVRKAQWLSSKNRYEDAIQAYNDLIDRLKALGDSSTQNISHNYTQLALLQLKIDKPEDARHSFNEALKYNSSNDVARRSLRKLDSPGIVGSGVHMEHRTRKYDLPEIIDSVLQDDLTRHSFVDPEASMSNGNIAITVADRLLAQAESDDTQNSYLEAAKAYSLSGTLDENGQQNYAKALCGYAMLKSKSLFNAVANSSYKDKELLRLVDGAFCYFVSVINLSSYLGLGWTAYFRDYLRMRIFYLAKNKMQIDTNSFFDNHLEDFIESNKLGENLDLLIECSEVLISLGAKCPIVRDSMYGDYGKSISYIVDLIHSCHRKVDFFNKLNSKNKCTHIVQQNSIEETFVKYIDQRIKQLDKLQTKINLVKKKSVEALFEEKSAKAFDRVRKLSSHLTETDHDIAIIAVNLIKSLLIFKSRTMEERQILVHSLRQEISNNLKTLNEISSYLSSELLKELWEKLLKSKSLSISTKSHIFTELIASADGNIILSGSGSYQIPITIKNIGQVTIDNFKAIVTFSEASQILQHEYNGKRLYPGDDVALFIDIPNVISDLKIYDYKIQLRGFNMNSWLAPREFNLTASHAVDINFIEKDIKWDFQRKETREEMFKGRKSEIDKLVETFTSIDRRKIPVVFGLTRTGKSSILLNLKSILKGYETLIDASSKNILPIYIDLSTITSLLKDHDSFIRQFWVKCTYDFDSVGLQYDAFSPKSLEDIIDFVNENGMYPLFMFDEFTYVRKIIEVEGNEFLKTIREYAIDQRAGFIYAGTYDILDIIRDPNLNPAGAFMNIDEYKIYSIQDPLDAESLIRVMEPNLCFTQSAVESIHMYSGDVPYWIQVICHYCAKYAIKHKRPVIGTKELDDVVQGILGEKKVDGVISMSDLQFEQQQILGSDPKETKSLLFSIAYLMKDASNQNGVSWTRLKEFWLENNYNPDMQSIVTAKERLEDRLCILSSDIDGTSLYRFSVGLFRRWCARKDVFSELDKTNII